jgi:hypothetical protein
MYKVCKVPLLCAGELARFASSRVIVLLKNSMKNTNGTLPVDFRSFTGSLAVIGPNADAIEALWGDYAGPSAGANVTARQAAVAELGEARVRYAIGCAAVHTNDNPALCDTDTFFDAAIAAAKGSKMVLAVMGTQGCGSLDGPHTKPLEVEGHDRLNISLPGLQETLLKRVKAAVPDVPLVVALMSGGAVSSPWVRCASSHRSYSTVAEQFWGVHVGALGNNIMHDVTGGGKCRRGAVAGIQWTILWVGTL